MNTINLQTAVTERAERRVQDGRAELVDRIAEIMDVDGVVEPLAGIHLARSTHPLERIHSIYPAAFCVIAQGSKEVYIGNMIHRYDADHYLVATMELPAVSKILRATHEKPYLSMRMNIDSVMVGSVMAESGLSIPRSRGEAKAVAVSTLDADLLDACVRLVRLVHSPSKARFLVPLVKREIVFRLLTGDQGNRLRHMPVMGGISHSIVRAIEVLRTNFDQPFNIEALARDMGMSPSGFHYHFRMVTDLSPLQFQKQMRLQQARTLMLGEDMDAASAGYRVGYTDASHFSRDYRKLFGAPPARDVERLKVTLSTVPPEISA